MDTPGQDPQDNNQIPESAERDPLHSEGSNDGGGFFGWLKSALVFLVLVAIVIASFWVSFQLGKRILVPVKKPERRIDVAIPEPPASLKELAKALSREAEMKMKARKPKLALSLPPAGIPAKIAEVKVHPRRDLHKKGLHSKKLETRPVKPVEIKVAAADHYYKVQAAVYRDKDNANAMAEKLKNAGFDIYVKKLQSGWRVQVGAFRTKTEADNLCKALSGKGFRSTVLYE
jgi:hypothetical protein